MVTKFKSFFILSDLDVLNFVFNGKWNLGSPGFWNGVTHLEDLSQFQH